MIVIKIILIAMLLLVFVGIFGFLDMLKQIKKLD